MLHHYGCESVTLDQNIPIEQPVTRSIPADFTDYNSFFLNPFSQDYGYGVESMTGTLKSYGKDVEYHLSLFCALTGDVKCKVETSDGDIVYNAQTPTNSIYGISGQKIRFIHKKHYTNGESYVTLKIEKGTSKAFKAAEARLVVEKVVYQGEEVKVGLDGSTDLYLQMTIPGESGSGYPESGTQTYHWTCKKCNFTNSTNTQTCLNCGAKQTNYLK